MNFADLKYTAQEIDKISSTLDSTSFTILGNEQATKTNVLQKIGDHNLLYFATHGISSSKNPLGESFLVLTKDTKEQDEILTASNIQHIKNKDSKKTKQ